MPGPAHETLVAVLSQRPDLLDLLLRALGHPGLSQPLEARDSALRVANPLEVRPDVVLLGEGERGTWMIVEVQLARDDDKRRRWLSAAATLLDARGAMGDLVVITHDASVAAWASEVAQAIGPNGTQLALAPVVVTLTLAEAHRLLTSERGELAMFAAWAVHDQRGREARQVVREAVGAIDAVPDARLRDTLARAMISMLGEPLLVVIREMLMDPVMFPVNPEFKAIREEIEAVGEARGEARALLTVLSARGLVVDPVARERIERCDDTGLLTRWIARAVTAASADEVFAEAGAASGET